MSTSTPAPILIGDLLVRSEMATPRELADALPISLKTGLPVGRVLIGSGALTEDNLQQALMAQSLIRDSMLTLDLAIQALRIVARERYSLEQALNIVGWTPETFSSENKLGQLLMHAGVINQEQLEQSLRVFYNSGLPLARILVRKGIISNLVAYAALSSQQLLRDNKLSREQAVQAIRSAAQSNARIEDDYVTGYLRISPANTLRLGELLILGKLIDEESLIGAVETALRKGETIGEVLIAQGLIRQDTMERALEAQRMITKGTLDVAIAGDVLKRSDFERLSIQQVLDRMDAEREADLPVIQQLQHQSHHKDDKTGAHRLPQQPAGATQQMSALPPGSIPDILKSPPPLPNQQQQQAQSPSQPQSQSQQMQAAKPFPQAPPPLPQELIEQAKELPKPAAIKRSDQEMRVRQLASKLVQKLEALHTRNNYMVGMLDHGATDQIGALDLRDMKAAIENADDFDAYMDVVDKLFTKLETHSFQHGMMRCALDNMTTNNELMRRLQDQEKEIERLRSKV